MIAFSSPIRIPPGWYKADSQLTLALCDRTGQVWARIVPRGVRFKVLDVAFLGGWHTIASHGDRANYSRLE